MRKKYLLLSFLVILFFSVFFLFTSSTINADPTPTPAGPCPKSYNISVNPQSVKPGTDVTITTTITGICDSSTRDSYEYNLLVLKGKAAVGKDRTYATLGITIPVPIKKCVPQEKSAGAIVKSMSCTPNGQDITATFVIDTTKLGADPNATTESVYDFILQSAKFPGSDLGNQGTLILEPISKPVSGISIDSFEPPVTDTFPKPGDVITINVSGTVDADYEYGIVGTSLSKSRCAADSCALKYTLPNPMTNRGVIIIVKGPNGQATKPLLAAIPTDRPIDPNRPPVNYKEPKDIKLVLCNTQVKPEELYECRSDAKLDDAVRCGVDNLGFGCHENKGTNQVLCAQGKTVKCAVYKEAPQPCKDIDSATGLCKSLETGIGNIKTDVAGFVKSLFTTLLSLSGGIALLLIIYSGYRLMTSQGNPETIKGAQETLTSAIVGLLFIIFSMVVLQVIGVDILRIPGFK